MRPLNLAIVVMFALFVSFVADADTFTNKVTGEVVKGKFMGAATKDGQKVYHVKGDDGQLRQLPESDWERGPDAPACRPGSR